MANYHLLVLGACPNLQLPQRLHQHYQVEELDTVAEVLAAIASQQNTLILVNEIRLEMATALAMIKELKAEAQSADLPLVMLADADDLTNRIDACEVGCDDFITRASLEELPVRLERVMFNQLANQQLKTQLQQANEMAFIAMSDTSDLGVNIQFLLDSNHCNNLDELGMRLFQALKRYDINCSLQLRSRHGEKNMEINGMAKEMESVLLRECAHQGRYVDFGKRSIMNYGDVSLLVKNMPLDDDKKYGAIKDNVFSLLQGAHARLQALDDQQSLEQEGELVKQMSVQMRSLMAQVDESYQQVMRDIASVVENMADGIGDSIQYLGLNERQEVALEEIMENGIVETNRIFNQGMNLDKGLQEFMALFDSTLAAKKAEHDQQHEQQQQQRAASLATTGFDESTSAPPASDCELF